MSNAQKQQWQRKLSCDRLGMEGDRVFVLPCGNKDDKDNKINFVRSDFHVDYDRVVFSRAFRRLGRKTQVHSFARSDHIHNRLTHSVEVASVGRSLGNRVGAHLAQKGILPCAYTPNHIGTVVQVACLAHDLGNPPFGHIGEAALREWFSDPKNGRFLEGLSDAQKADVCAYEGNAHSLRTVARLEMRSNKGGMQLSGASLGALLKYPWGSDHPNAKRSGKFNVYQSEMPLIQQVAAQLDLPTLDGASPDRACAWARHPLSYLMEAADDICYALLDLEDAVELGLIAFEDFARALLPIAQDSQSQKPIGDVERCGALRGAAIGRCVQAVAGAFMNHHDDLLNGRFAHKDLLTAADPSVKAALDNAKKLAAQKIFCHNGKLVNEIAAFACLGSILDIFVPAVFARHTRQKLSTKSRLALEYLGFSAEAGGVQTRLYDDYMAVLDFVCALTDNTAAKLARDLSGFGMG